MKKKQQDTWKKGIKKTVYQKSISNIYYILLLIIGIMVLANVVLSKKVSVNLGLSEFSDVTSDWVDETGNPVIFNEIRHDGSDTSDCSIFYRLPIRMDKDTSMVFRTRNTNVSVRIQGLEIYHTECVPAPFNNHSSGTRWNLVRIPKADAGKTVEVRLTYTYRDGKSGLGKVYLGDRAAILVHIIQHKLLAALVSALIFGVGCIYLITGLLLNCNRMGKDYGLIYLGIFALVSAVWCLLETNLVQLFCHQVELLQLLNSIMLLVAGIPIYLYLDSIYGIFQYRIIRLYCVGDLIYIILSTCFQILGIYDYHQMIWGALLCYIIAAILLVTCIAKQGYDYSKNQGKEKTVLYLLRQIGTVFLGIAITLDLIRYVCGDVVDRALVTRIGLFIFIVCFGIGNIYRLFQLVKHGIQAEFISKLAYTDGLTELSNRTAYMERLESLEQECEPIKAAIIMLDINNLKLTNDTLGHHYGDLLIRTCARIISETFGQLGEVFRIGGDEFTVLVQRTNSEDHLREHYEEVEQEFLLKIAQENASMRNQFQVSIAYGIGYYDALAQNSLSDAQELADQAMYRKKREEKAEIRRIQMNRTIIFDMDGVIFDTEHLFLTCWEEIASKYDIRNVKDVVMKCIGTNNVKTKEIVMEYYGPDFPYEEYRAEVTKQFMKHIQNEGMPMKLGVKELLEDLKAKGYRIGLASSTREEQVKNELTMAGLIDYFDQIVCGDMVKKSKPEPDIFLECARQMNAVPAETYVIEDSYNGIRAASRAGMRPIMVPDLIPADEEMKKLAYLILDNLLEVKEHLNKQ